MIGKIAIILIGPCMSGKTHFLKEMDIPEFEVSVSERGNNLSHGHRIVGFTSNESNSLNALDLKNVDEACESIGVTKTLVFYVPKSSVNFYRQLRLYLETPSNF